MPLVYFSVCLPESYSSAEIKAVKDAIFTSLDTLPGITDVEFQYAHTDIGDETHDAHSVDDFLQRTIDTRSEYGELNFQILSKTSQQGLIVLLVFRKIH